MCDGVVDELQLVDVEMEDRVLHALLPRFVELLADEELERLAVDEARLRVVADLHDLHGLLRHDPEQVLVVIGELRLIAVVDDHEHADDLVLACDNRRREQPAGTPQADVGENRIFRIVDHDGIARLRDEIIDLRAQRIALRHRHRCRVGAFSVVRDQDALVADQERREPHTEILATVTDELVESMLPLGECADLIVRMQHEVQLFAAIGELRRDVFEARGESERLCDRRRPSP